MNAEDLETVYEAMAQALDSLPQDARELYLAKLALALCDTLGEAAPCLQAIAECRTGLGVPDEVT